MAIRGGQALRASPVHFLRFSGRRFWVKRDDLYSIPGTGLAGNKARKLYSLASQDPKAFPRILGSHGGAQSNAMVALARLADARDAAFVYFTRPIPKALRDHPRGNYAEALGLGAAVVEVQPDAYNTMIPPKAELATPNDWLDRVPSSLRKGAWECDRKHSLWVPRGGAYASAEAGVAALAGEILNWWTRDRLDNDGDDDGLDGVESGARPRECSELRVFLPSGTGSTALFLARHLSSDTSISVVAVPCVGDAEHLHAQMEVLDVATGSHAVFPTILDPGSNERKRYRFGSPHPDMYNTWKRLGEAGLDIDLIYAPRAWNAILMDNDEADGVAWLYVHTGGLEGVSSMLERYADACS